MVETEGLAYPAFGPTCGLHSGQVDAAIAAMQGVQDLPCGGGK